MHDIQIEFDVAVPMSDGTILRADIYRPSGEGPFPVLVCRSPYGKGILRDSLLDFKQIVRAGYVFIQQDVRGAALSEGAWLPLEHETEDGRDTIAWAASLPYSTGRVGMFGGSYLGHTQWRAALSGAPALRAIAPAITWSDPEDGLVFRGGAIELGLNGWWALGQALGQYFRIGLPPEEAMARMSVTLDRFDRLVPEGFWELPSGALPVLVEAGQPDRGAARILADRSAAAVSRLSDRYDEIDVPSLSFVGWYDILLQGGLDNYAGMRSRGRTARLIVGPWEHTTMFWAWSGGQVGDVNYGFGAQTPGGRTYTDIQQEWFDHWLKDEPATEAHESGVLLFVMGANTWRAEPDWPLERARDTALYLGHDSSLSWDAPDAEHAEAAFTYDPADPVITVGGNVSFSSEFTAGPLDQRTVESRDDVLVFTTDPLDEDLEITGRVRATVFASTDGPSTDWVARLCEVDPAGTSRGIVDGIRRIHAEPGQVQEVDIDLWSTSILIRAGHRLRVHITSSCFPRWDRNLNTGEPELEGTTLRVASQKVYFDSTRPSRVVLPIVPE